MLPEDVRPYRARVQTGVDRGFRDENWVVARSITEKCGANYVSVWIVPKESVEHLMDVEEKMALKYVTAEFGQLHARGDLNRRRGIFELFVPHEVFVAILQKAFRISDEYQLGDFFNAKILGDFRHAGAHWPASVRMLGTIDAMVHGRPAFSSMVQSENATCPSRAKRS